MDRQLFALSLGLLGCILIASQSRADEAPRCGPRDEIVGQLLRGWGESPRATGLVGSRAVLELYASDATGTFSIIATLPDGRACLIAAGDHYAPVAAEPPGAPA